jgi:hypothetical protein
MAKYAKEATHSWEDAGGWTTGPDVIIGGIERRAHYGYPQSCFGPSSSVFLSYYILSLAYAPPGCTPLLNYDCPSNFQSYANYESDSTTGASTSTEASVQPSVVLTAEIGSEKLGVSGSGSFGWTQTSTDGSKMEITKETDEIFPVPAVGGDGIDHDYDTFVLFLNPVVTMSTWQDPVNLQNGGPAVHAQWSIGTGGYAARRRYVHVSYLRCALAGIGPGAGPPYDPATYDDDGKCAQALADASQQGTQSLFLMPLAGNIDAHAADGFLPGVTNADYRAILSQDPFWNASPSNPVTIPVPRFTQQSKDFQYQQAFADPTSGNPAPVCYTAEHKDKFTNTATATSSSKTEYNTTVQGTIGTPLIKIIKLTAQNEFTWSSETSSESTKSDSQAADIQIGCHSSQWTGLSDISVYYDNVYGTYLFSFDDHSGQVRLIKGHVRQANGAAIPGVSVSLVDGTKTYDGFTNHTGDFALYRSIDTKPEPVAQLFVDGVLRKEVVVGPRATTEVVITPPSPVLTVAVQTRPEGSANLLMGVTNLSGITTATNVTVTAITGITATGATFVYNPGLLVSPFKVPGAAALKPNATSDFNLDFITTSGSAAGPFSFVITVKADNVPAFSTTINVL